MLNSNRNQMITQGSIPS